MKTEQNNMLLLPKKCVITIWNAVSSKDVIGFIYYNVQHFSLILFDFSYCKYELIINLPKSVNANIKDKKKRK